MARPARSKARPVLQVSDVWCVVFCLVSSSEPRCGAYRSSKKSIQCCCATAGRRKFGRQGWREFSSDESRCVLPREAGAVVKRKKGPAGWLSTTQKARSKIRSEAASVPAHVKEAGKRQHNDTPWEGDAGGTGGRWCGYSDVSFPSEQHKER
jgi:hypothetical protein